MIELNSILTANDCERNPRARVTAGSWSLPPSHPFPFPPRHRHLFLLSKSQSSGPIVPSCLTWTVVCVGKDNMWAIICPTDRYILYSLHIFLLSIISDFLHLKLVRGFNRNIDSKIITAATCSGHRIRHFEQGMDGTELDWMQLKPTEWKPTDRHRTCRTICHQDDASDIRLLNPFIEPEFYSLNFYAF